MERMLFIIKFPAETWKNIEVEIRKTFQKYFGAKLLSHPGRPSMDILVRSWHDLAKILENFYGRSCQDIAKK